jgi:hypothetical protein
MRPWILESLVRQAIAALLGLALLCGPGLVLAAGDAAPPAGADAAPAAADSLSGGKNFWRASGEIFATNLLIWSYDRYIRENGTNPGFRIGFDSWAENLKNGFEWDDNSFSTNQFAHPYHGSIYFNAARDNGYDYWESIPFTFGGSFMWEYFGEVHHASMNDWIATSVGGVALGEVLYRFSDLILDNTATGGGRRWREIAGLVVNPGRGVNRLLTGEAFRVGPNPPGKHPGYLGSSVRFGLRSISENHIGVADTTGMFADLAFNYGDPFSGRATDPFDYFTFGLELDAQEKSALARANAVGLLYGGDVRKTDETQHYLGAFQYYDYFNNRAFEFGGQSVGAGLLSKFDPGRGMEFRTSLHATALLVGGTSTDYAAFSGREYDYGPGVGFRLGAGFRRSGWDVLSVGTQQFWIYPLNGNAGHHVVSMTAVRAQIPIRPEIAAGFDYTLYLADRYYRDYPDVHARYPILRGFVAFKLD